MAARPRNWFVALAAIAAAGLLVRLVYAFAFKNPLSLLGDAWYYHYAANLLADGKGFISPIGATFRYTVPQGPVPPGPAADHPPGYIVALAIPSAFGFTTQLAHQVWSCFIGTATIVVVGYTGRVIAGPRVGLIAATLAALSPNFWLNDALIMSETLAMLMTALTVLAAYQFWRHPDGYRAAVLGVALAALILTRAEATLLVPLLVAPLAVIAAKRNWKRAAVLALISTAVLALGLAPWIIYNQSRFERPVFVSHGLGWTMQSGNCDEAYRGYHLGSWDFACAGQSIDGDGSVRDEEYRKRALRYMRGHLNELPWVIVAREGRTFGFFRPAQQFRIDRFETTKDVEASMVGLFVFYALVPASFIGARVLRRRGVPVVPLVALVAMVAITVALTFGQTRYRMPAEVGLVLLGAVAIDAGITRVRSRNAAPTAVPREPLTVGRE